MTVHCSACCPSCGRHFASNSAHALHRVGDFDASPDSENRRRCASPFELLDRHGAMRLELRSENGVCTLGAERLMGVSLWGEARARLRAAEAFNAERKTAVVEAAG